MKGILNFITAGKHSFGQGRVIKLCDRYKVARELLSKTLIIIIIKVSTYFLIKTLFLFPGVITYANNPPQFNSFSKYLQNRICTVADSFRVADDFGKLRCQLTYLNKPIFGWKGSYVVCNVSG